VWRRVDDVSVRLETARLVIRPFVLSDRDWWLAMVNDPEFERFLPPSPPATAEDFVGMVERRAVMERERGYAMWAVEEAGTGSCLGQCGLYPAEGKGPEVELAYHVDKAFWKRGYATEAAASVLAYALGQLSLERVISFVIPENVASCRVAEKIGMQLEGEVTAYDIEGLRLYAAGAGSER
jgi:[ribosomal protein S5]-alanine N-acetyltransferase